MRVFRQTALATVSVVAIATSATADEALREEALDMFSPVPSTIPAMTDNPITPAKIDLGKALFFDPRMSASGVFSCNSCHSRGWSSTKHHIIL